MDQDEILVEQIQRMDLGTANTPPVEKEKTRNILLKYKSVFKREGKQCMQVGEHRLELKDYTPIRQRPYRTNWTSQKIIDETVEQLLEEGIISKSDSDWASPVLLVKKKTGDLRLCVDYRVVNKVLRKDEWPLPRIQDIMDTLGNARYFSVLDLKAGFHQIKMAEESKKNHSIHYKERFIRIQLYAIWISHKPKRIQQISEQNIQ